jgi:hypothetical protein
MFVEQRKEKSELLRELVEKGAGIDPLPVLSQVSISAVFFSFILVYT